MHLYTANADAMKPNGPAVEKIHGRLAMAMFLPAVAREMSSAETMVQQLQHPDWRLVALSISIFYATMIPVLKDVRDEDFFWMTVRAEKVNGRVAMLAWAIVLTLEWLTEVCFF